MLNAEALLLRSGTTYHLESLPVLNTTCGFAVSILSWRMPCLSGDNAARHLDTKTGPSDALMCQSVADVVSHAVRWRHTARRLVSHAKVMLLTLR